MPKSETKDTSQGIGPQEPTLPYLRAVIKETLGLYPAGPLSLPHEATEDRNVSGYYIPKGTRLILNLHKIHCDLGVCLDEILLPSWEPLNQPLIGMLMRGDRTELWAHSIQQWSSDASQGLPRFGP